MVLLRTRKTLLVENFRPALLVVMRGLNNIPTSPLVVLFYVPIVLSSSKELIDRIKEMHGSITPSPPARRRFTKRYLTLDTQFGLFSLV